MTAAKISGSLRKDVKETLEETIGKALANDGWTGMAVVEVGVRRTTRLGQHARDDDKPTVDLDILGIEFAGDPKDEDTLRRVQLALHRKNTAVGTLDEGSAEGLVLQHAAELVGDDTSQDAAE